MSWALIACLQVLESLGGVEGVERGIGWDPNFHQRHWDVQHLAEELMKKGYNIN